MGGQGSGRKQYLKTLRLAVKLRAEGLTLQEIGRRVGVSRQWVERLLAAHGDPHGKLATIKCRECGAVIGRIRRPGQGDRQARCLVCLAKHPKTTFGERLQGLRLAAGLSKQDLAKRIGMTGTSIWGYEGGTCRPSSPALAKLVKVLGAGLVNTEAKGE